MVLVSKNSLKFYKVSSNLMVNLPLPSIYLDLSFFIIRIILESMIYQLLPSNLNTNKIFIYLYYLGVLTLIPDLPISWMIIFPI